MKNYLPVVLTLACAALIVSLLMIKHGDDTRHLADTGAFETVSNQLTTAQTDIAFRDGRLLELSNTLSQTQSSVTTFSNQLAEAEASILLCSGQITNLNQQLATVQAAKQASDQHIMELTNQLAGLNEHLNITRTNLNQSIKDYALLENRLRIDVAKRLVLEKQFHTPSELQAQLKNLKQDPFHEITADTIYAGLDIEVKSNSFHVITPN